MRSTNSAPDFLSNSYFTGSPPTGTSMTTLMLPGGSSPTGMRSMFMVRFSGQVPGAPKHRQSEEQSGECGGDRSHDIASGRAIGIAFDQQRGIEREGRECGEAAKDAGRQEQAHVLRNTCAIREIAGQESYRERAGHIDDQRPEREAEPEQPRRPDIHAVAQRAADPGTDEDDQVKHGPPTAARLRS